MRRKETINTTIRIIITGTFWGLILTYLVLIEVFIMIHGKSERWFQTDKFWAITAIVICLILYYNLPNILNSVVSGCLS